jgi:hypothetical protein
MARKRWTPSLVVEFFESKGLTVLEPGEEAHCQKCYAFECMNCGMRGSTTVVRLQNVKSGCLRCSYRVRGETNHQRSMMKNEQKRQARKEQPQPHVLSVERKAKPTKPHKKRAITYSMGPRYPEPPPQRVDYLHLSDEEWKRMARRYQNSTLYAKRRRADYEQRNRDKINELQKKKRRRLNWFRKQLLKLISANGKCCYKDPESGEFVCSVAAEECDIDHMDPNTRLADGKRRKQGHFACMTSWSAIERELKRNASPDGTLLLQALCPNHHSLKSFSCPLEQIHNRQMRERMQAVNKIKIGIRKCQFAKCPTPDFVCTSDAVAPAFHFDHLFTALEDDIAGEFKKVAEVGRMVVLVGEYSMDDIHAEIAKCRLVHALCHRKISALQIKQGRL